jgi:hypothetical protein
VRSESPAPEAKRPAELAAQPILAVDAGWSDDAAAVRSAEEREEALRAERAKTARLTVELDRERKSREPPLPSPKAARQREQTRHDWPPNEGYLPGMPESTPPMRGKLESHQHLHVILEREARARDESLPPRSARQRAGDAIKGARQPLLVTLISTILSGGGVTAILTARQGQQPEMPATSVGAGVKLKENQRNLAADLAANDRGDRAHEKWDIEEHRKFDERLRQCERKQRRMPDESLEPEAPPAAPAPPRKPDLPERIGQ